jgi:hypothetical protein
MSTREHEQGSTTVFFLEYSSHIDMIFKAYFVTPSTKYLVMWKNIFPRVEWYLWMRTWMKMMMDEHIHEHIHEYLQ